MKKENVLFVLMFFLSFLLQTASADEKPLKLDLKGELVVVEEHEGKKAEKLAPLPEKVRNGDVIHYTIHGKNNSSGILKKVEVVGRIPEGTEFLPDSVHSVKKAEVLFSIDNGSRYAKPPIRIKVRMANGAVEEQEAPASRYTNIKFVIDQLGIKEDFSGSYRVKVK